MKEHLYGVVIRKGRATRTERVSAENLEGAFGKAAVLAQGSGWPEWAEDCTLTVRRIHSPHGPGPFGRPRQ
jgi:hypothetical protein